MTWVIIGAILLLGIYADKEKVAKFLLRTAVGGAGIWLLNLCLNRWGIPGYVGLNEVTLLTCGVLGLPGFIGLYGLGIYGAMRG